LQAQFQRAKAQRPVMFGLIGKDHRQPHPRFCLLQPGRGQGWRWLSNQKNLCWYR
jgi:hypothetical protein